MKVIMEFSIPLLFPDHDSLGAWIFAILRRRTRVPGSLGGADSSE